MMPLTLSFEGFGPYVEKQFIDFRKFQSAGLFLIHGETGSGKTVILDAITFALYGKSSGGTRGDLAGMRCQIAADSVQTSVEYTFAINGKQYKFVRELKVRNKRDGTIEYLQDQAAFYLDENGIYAPFEESRGVKKIEEKAEELIGLTYEQFRQVIILPQGQFERLLVAKSEEKEEIFVTLFNAEKWHKIAENICTKASEMQNAITLEEEGLKTILSSQECLSEVELSEKIEKMREDFLEQTENRKGLENKLAQSKLELSVLLDVAKKFEELDKLETENKELLKEKESTDYLEKKLILAKSAEAVNPAWEAVNIIKKEKIAREKEAKISLENKNETKNELERSEEISRLIATRKNEMAAKALENERLKGLKVVYETFEAVEKEYSNSNLKFDNAYSKYKATEGKISEFSKEIEKLNEEKDNIISEYTSKIPEIRQQCEEYEKQKQSIYEIELILEGIKLIEEEMKSKNAELNKKKEKLNEKKQVQSKLNEANYNNAIAAIANALEAGQACPVCGSTSHPSISENKIKEYDEKELKEINNEIDTICQEIVILEKANIQLSLKKDSELEKIKKLEKSSAGKPTYDNISHAKTSELLKKAIDENEKLKAIQLNINEINEAIQKSLLDKDEANKIREETLAKKEKDTAAYNNILGKLDRNISDINSLKNRTDILEKELEEYNNNLKTIDEKLALDRTSATTSEVRYNQAVKELEKVERQLLDLISNMQTKLHESGFLSEEEFLAAIMDKAESTLIEQGIKNYKMRCEMCQQKRAVLSRALESENRPDIESQNKILSDLEEEKASLISQSGVIEHKINTCDEILQKALITRFELEDSRKKQQKIKTFGTILRGDTGIGLRRYVLGVMLTSITLEANRMLKDVHGGRYQLYRTLEGFGRNRKAGLDLEILDAVSGKKRSVAGLSGGEKFLVSLSLSLGLSSVVQAQAGGIHIDAMFIDEGFGSLDPGSIRDALHILSSVKGSKRLVGIISHVPELKENIETAIEVQKNQKGSKLIISV